MAGDWIKMRKDLHQDPAVLAMARELGTRPEAVVGYLHKFWSWVDTNCSVSIVQNLEKKDVENVLNVPGFLELMEEVGWLKSGEGPPPWIRIPKFERHLSQSAKRRAGENRRKERVRKMSAPDADKKRPREEKSKRVSKDTLKKSKPKERFRPPSVAEVRGYCQERGNGIDPELFVSSYTSKGWMVGRQPMRDWKAAVRTWERNRVSEGNSRGPSIQDLLPDGDEPENGNVK